MKAEPTVLTAAKVQWSFFFSLREFYLSCFLFGWLFVVFVMLANLGFLSKMVSFLFLPFLSLPFFLFFFTRHPILFFKTSFFLITIFLWHTFDCIHICSPGPGNLINVSVAVVLDIFVSGLKRFTLLNVTEDHKMFLFMWVSSIHIYHVRNEGLRHF